ncbi:MAG: thiol peroxidase [Propionibacteriaceae bacterium]|jgi:thiol peroxidase|nr:thiol peroxidase [Propionibacteriaceae bacterium]
MATTQHGETTVHTVGDLPPVGSRLPAFQLDAADLTAVTNDSVAGAKAVFNIFPSVDTGVCAMSVRRFNQIAASLPGVKVVCVSKDLPFALGRFCGAEGIENVTVASAFRSSFGEDFGVTMLDGALRGLLARSVVVADADGNVVYTELVPSIGQEPDYDAAVAALG